MFYVALRFVVSSRNKQIARKDSKTKQKKGSVTPRDRKDYGEMFGKIGKKKLTR